MNESRQLVQKLWNYCNILRDDGLSYGDYALAWLSTDSEQLTFLLFLKMADEHGRPPFNKTSPIPKVLGWGLCWAGAWHHNLINLEIRSLIIN